MGFPVFLFFASGPAFMPSALSLTLASFNFSYLILFSLPLLMGVTAPMASIAPLLMGTLEEVPMIRSQPDQVFGKSYA